MDLFKALDLVIKLFDLILKYRQSTKKDYRAHRKGKR